MTFSSISMSFCCHAKQPPRDASCKRHVEQSVSGSASFTCPSNCRGDRLLRARKKFPLYSADAEVKGNSDEKIQPTATALHPRILCGPGILVEETPCDKALEAVLQGCPLETPRGRSILLVIYVKSSLGLAQKSQGSSC